MLSSEGREIIGEALRFINILFRGMSTILLAEKATALTFQGVLAMDLNLTAEQG